MSSQETYVKTAEIKDAAKGRETDVLDALGIEWRRSKGHVDCPYPAHAGKRDWRWEDKKKRAFCTCNTPGHADTIFDVVAKCDGLGDDFEAIKLRMADLLGRQDLIRPKGNQGNQRQDAASLLHPPTSQRDDDLPRAYLAHRLQVEPAALVMPTTPTAGFKALAFFDPKADNGKFPHVGDFPCAVFGMVGVDGRQHAQRIYVAPGGQGKADLGQRADGKQRDPKKSARVAENDNITSRAVLWGDPVTATWTILGEGIETCAAVAHVFRAEIQAGSVLVAAGVSANGVQGFGVYPNTQRVTVAADRDEKAIPSKPHASRAGERAAREFGIRHHDNLDIRIALPGKPGEKADWLDVFLASGEASVRSEIERAAIFTPTMRELDDRIEQESAHAEIARIAAECPLPTIYGTHLEYRRLGGEVWAHKTMLVGKGEDRETIFVPVFTPFGATARLKYAGDEQAYGLRLVALDMGGQMRTLDIERTDLAKLGAAEARAMLFGAGLRTMDDGEKIVVECLKAVNPPREIRVVRKPGWHEISGLDAPVYVCPDGTVFGLPPDRALELSTSAKLSPQAARGGTLDGWKASVSAAAMVNGCPHWIIGTIAGFAGVLIDLCNMDSSGINFSGLSSSGKTTGQRFAASAWSKPVTQGDTLFQTAKATVNSLEQMAARSNGSVLVLDELAHVTGKEVGKIIYTLAGGIGKKRMTSSATVREPYAWNTFAVLSAETSLEEKIRKDDGEWTAGQAVRVADIDVTGIDRKVSADVMARIEGIKTNFGHAGPAFVQAIITAGSHRDPAAMRDAINSTAQRLAAIGSTSTESDAALVRAASVFAVLSMAGMLAKRIGLLPEPVSIETAVRWAWDRFRLSSDAVALDPEQQAVANIQAWVAERWASSLHDIDDAEDHVDGRRRPNRDAVGWFDAKAVYLLDKRLMEAAGGSLKETEVARVLKALGYLTHFKSDKHTFVDYVPKVGRVKAYALSRDYFGRGSEKAALKVVAGGRP